MSERFWKYKVTDNNKHDWFALWADIKLSGKEDSIFKLYIWHKK